MVTEFGMSPIASISTLLSSMAVVPSLRVVFTSGNVPDAPSCCMFVTLLITIVTVTSSAVTVPKPSRATSITQFPPDIFKVLSKTAGGPVCETVKPPSTLVALETDDPSTLVNVCGTST